LAGETGTQGSTGSGTQGSTGSGFPVFKSVEGAFDRAKFHKTISSGAGSIITPETFDAMKAADSAGQAAKLFYAISFNKNLRELDPEFRSDLVFYRLAYSEDKVDKNLISEDIDEGKSVDGKDIFEMSKRSAKQKYNNAKILKEGNVTQIIENIGSISEIEGFESYDSVKDEFDSKIKDEKLKFDVLSDKFLDILGYFNQEGASVNAKMLYTPENNAMISAFAKILEGEGFNSASVLEMSKRYDDNIKKLIESKEGKKAEDVIKDAAQEAKKEEAKTKTEETKIEEKKSETPSGPTGSAQVAGSTGSAGSTGTVESASNETKKTETPTTGPTASTSTENLTNKSTTGTTGTTGGTGGTGKAEDIKTGNKKGKKGKDTTPALSESNKGILEMLGLKMPSKEGDKKEGEGGDEKGKGKGKGTTTGSAEVDKTLEELGFKKPKEESGDTKGKGKGKTDNKSKSENKETKLDEKVSTNNDKKTETSTTNTPIKETTTQNLSSVNTPTTDKTEDKKEDTKTTTSTITSTENKTEDKKSDTEVKTEGTQQKEGENKEKTGDQDKAMKELGDNMKSMVTLLTQLNNTLKNPLIVIPNGKKFH
jgi:hypothetical protein